MYADLLDLNAPMVWTVGNVLSNAECGAWIARIDAAQPLVAPITTAAGPVHDTRARNNERVMFDDPNYAALLFEQLREHLPQRLQGGHAHGLNERFRCYRYQTGQHFAPHYDGSFVRDDHERSLLTVLVYLNGGFEGGETAFLDLDREVVPEPGLALLFQHPVLHEGRAVTRGMKYVLRTDVMYRFPT